MTKGKAKLYGIALLLFLSAAILSILFGAVGMDGKELLQAVALGPNHTAGYIFWYVRLPRTAACLLAGAALSVSGCVLQNVLGNHLASPGIVGVNAGAGLAVTICCAAGLLSGWAIALSAFAGALAAAMLVVVLSRATGASRTTVILAGVAINSIFGALRDAVTTLVPEAGVLSGEFRVGGFSSVVHTRLISAAVLILLALAAVYLLHHELDVLMLGEDTAKALGLNVAWMRREFLLLSALLAGAAVSFSGLLGFVGLLVPHAVRKLTGSENCHLLPLCALFGAAFVTLCDLAGRVLFAPYELPVGILLSVIGGPVFLALLLKKRGGRSHA